MNKTFIVLLIICLTTALAHTTRYREGTIRYAQTITRPLHIPHVPKQLINTLDKIGINHQAVKITTDTGKKYVMSNNPTNGIHVTDANLSNKWTVKQEIKVNGNKKIGDVLNNVNGIGNGLTSYITTGTCIGTTTSIKNELEK